MNTDMLHLLAYLLLEPVKRVLSAVLYPVAYALRHKVRYQTLTPIDWRDYLRLPLHGYWWPLWLLLDDSVFIEFGVDYGNREKYFPAFVWASGSDFLKAYWWSAIRNSCVNWNNYAAMKLGRFLSEEPHDGKRNFYVTRTYEHARRPYCEFWLFGRWNQIGWLRGNKLGNGASRFEIDVMKRRS